LDQVQAALPGDVALLGWVDLGDAGHATAHHWGCLVRREGEPVWVKVPGTGPDRAWVKADARRDGELRPALAYRETGGGNWPRGRRPRRADAALPRRVRRLACSSPDLAGVPVRPVGGVARGQRSR
jgi:hypothetical protein